MGRPNRGSSKQGPDSERMWRRFTSLFKSEELWKKSWTADELVDFLLEHEARPPSREDPKAYRKRILGDFQELIRSSRKRGQHFKWEGNNTVSVRTQESILGIEQSVAEWSTRLSRLEKEPLSNLDQWIDILDAWECLILNSPLQDRVQLHPEIGLTWKKFDLQLELKRLAARKSGLRFPEFEPALAMMLVKAGRWSILELLKHRLGWRRKNNDNPFPSTYETSLEHWAEQLPDVDASLALAEGRSDLRHLHFVTIDPPDAKDFDDAVCLEEHGNGRTLWVAIADVAHYVVKDSSLDATAQARATSVYLPHAVLPMLPFRLADDLCSLRANVPRLAMVIEMVLDEKNNVVSSHAHEAVVLVKENLAYEDTLDDERWNALFSLAESWQQDELRLNIQQGEQRPRIHGENDVSIEVKWPNKATKMIETFMVKTNNIVGEILGKAGAALPWRCHPMPDSIDVRDLNKQLEALDISIQLPEPRSKSKSQDDTDELAGLLGAWAGQEIDLSGLSSNEKNVEIEDYLSHVSAQDARDEMLDGLRQAQEQASALRSSLRRVVDQGLFQLMNRARYDAVNIGHFGLNLDAYAHFTSPIRRYPDLIVHRQLKAMLHETEWVYDKDEMTKLSEHCSQQGRLAQLLEWELVAMTLNYHLMDSEEVNWNARVVGLRTPWIFLDLNDDGSMHGRMHLKQLSSKKNLYIDDFGLSLLEEVRDGQGESVMLELGQLFPCRIRGLDLWSGRLDLAPV
ncbi:MAG: RNB domain-containing ribonuclease [Candidatus Poseidoniaceae archaeon]